MFSEKIDQGIQNVIDYGAHIFWCRGMPVPSVEHHRTVLLSVCYKFSSLGHQRLDLPKAS